MAKLSEITTVLTDATDLTEATVEAHVKTLRKAGLLTTGGRGTAAPDQTPLDCAHLVLSVLGGQPIKAVEFVSEYGSAVSSDATAPYEELEYFSSLLGLRFPHTLIEAVSALVQAHADGSIDAIAQMTGSPIGWLTSKTEFRAVSIEFKQPESTIYLRVECRDSISHDSEKLGTVTIIYRRKSDRKLYKHSSLRSVRSIDGYLFTLLGAVMKDAAKTRK